jgi:hypothetical protein
LCCPIRLNLLNLMAKMLNQQHQLHLQFHLLLQLLQFPLHLDFRHYHRYLHQHHLHHLMLQYHQLNLHHH